MEWEAFELGDVNRFTLSSTLNGLDKNKLIDSGDKIHPYITRTETTNGLDMFIGKQDKMINNGNVITIGLDTQTVFYQPANFYTGQNIQLLSFKELTPHIAMFIIPAIKKQLETLSWGGNGATLGRLKKKKIYLPVDQQRQPNWTFIEQYIQMKMTQLKERVELPKRNRITDFRSIDELTFKEFSLAQMVTIKNGVRLTKSKMQAGEIAFIGATEFRNGITGFINNKNVSTDANVLGVNYNGSVAESFYHPYQATFSDDVKRFSWTDQSKNNKYTLLFLKTMLNMQKIKYAYGYKFNSTRMKKQIIKLPIDGNGEPEWGFMEQYMKRQENRILERLIEFLVH